MVLLIHLSATLSAWGSNSVSTVLQSLHPESHSKNRQGNVSSRSLLAFPEINATLSGRIFFAFDHSCELQAMTVPVNRMYGRPSQKKEASKVDSFQSLRAESEDRRLERRKQKLKQWRETTTKQQNSLRRAPAVIIKKCFRKSLP